MGDFKWVRDHSDFLGAIIRWDEQILATDFSNERSSLCKSDMTPLQSHQLLKDNDECNDDCV